MVKSQNINSSLTEGRIMEAAREVFIRHGFDGTTMQQIADEAGMNKSLLHYYFRNKEKLFETVFAYAFRQFVPQIQDIMVSQASITDKIERIISEYMDLLLKNEILPAFILHEINRDPDRLYKIMQETGLNPDMFMKGMKAEMEQHKIRPMDPRHLIVNMLAMCIFPVAARPLIQRILFSNDTESYNRFLQERKKEIARFIIQSIQV
jgi:AcrR family transcriptional regulator